MARSLLLPLLLAVLAGAVPPGQAAPVDPQLSAIRTQLDELRAERGALGRRLEQVQEELRAVRDSPKIAFAASLGGNGAQKTVSGNRDLIYKDVLTNVGGAYNAETGEFTAPVRGVYYIRFTANAPTDFTMSAVLYKNDYQLLLIAHEQPSGRGSDTASNGAPFLLEKGDRLKMVLWHNTHIWDNSNHHSTFSGFLLFSLTELQEEEDSAAVLRNLQASVQQLQNDNKAVKEQLEATEKEMKAMRDVPKVAFAASLGGNGLQKTTTGMRKLIYSEVLTNVGDAYSAQTGDFTAPVRGVYYVRFTANGPNDFPISSVLYKNERLVQLIAHEQAGGGGSDTASNGAALLLEEGDRLSMQLSDNSQVWDNANHHSTFSGFLLYPL